MIFARSESIKTCEKREYKLLDWKCSWGSWQIIIVKSVHVILKTERLLTTIIMINIIGLA